MRNRLVKSEFARNVATLMTGTVIAQIIPLLFTPILTRLFSPEEFGVFAFFMSVIIFLSVLGAGRFEQAIVLPKEDHEAINVLALSFGILTSFVAVLFAVVLLFYDAIVDVLGVPSLRSWLWFVPICVFLTVSYRILTFWSNRNKRFKGTSSAYIGQATSRAATQITGGVLKHGVTHEFSGLSNFFIRIFDKGHVVTNGITKIGVGSLILSWGTGFFIGSLILFFPLFKRDRKLITKISKREMKAQARIFKKFPLINAWHALGDELKNVGVNAAILYGFGGVILGYYSITFRILRAPLGVIGSSFGQVFYQKAAEMHANGNDILPLVKNTTKKLLIIAVPIFTILIIFGPDIFQFVLGEKWRVAGVYAQYLAPWIMFGFIVSPIQQVGIIKNRQEQMLLFSILGNVIIFGSILIGAYWFEDILQGFLLLSVLQSIYLCWVYIWILRIAQKAPAR
ncbi:MAG: oligosaccharide flippase family protein [Crocinitomicaceae bacterium]